MIENYEITSWLGIFLYDWQTLIASSFALVAIIVTIRSTQSQLKLARQQMANINKSERRQWASDSIISGQLIGAVVSRMLATCTDTVKELGTRRAKNVLIEEDLSYYELIGKPDIETVWNSLRHLGREASKAYLDVNIFVDLLWNSKIGNCDSQIIITKFEELARIAEHCLDEIENNSKRAFEILAQDQ